MSILLTDCIYSHDRDRQGIQGTKICVNYDGISYSAYFDKDSYYHSTISYVFPCDCRVVKQSSDKKFMIVYNDRDSGYNVVLTRDDNVLTDVISSKSVSYTVTTDDKILISADGDQYEGTDPEFIKYIHSYYGNFEKQKDCLVKNKRSLIKFKKLSDVSKELTVSKEEPSLLSKELTVSKEPIERAQVVRTSTGIEWRVDGKLHRDLDEPAKIDNDGTIYYYKNGNIHRDTRDADGNVQYAIIGTDGIKYLYRNGKSFCYDDRPCEVLVDGTQIWKNELGQRHRDNDLPAVVYVWGSTRYYQNGKLHRIKGPACTSFRKINDKLLCNQFWCINDMIDRADVDGIHMPCIINTNDNGTMMLEWRRGGKIHRDPDANGTPLPAVIDGNNYKYYKNNELIGSIVM